MNNYKKGDIVKGIVTGFEKYGIFLSFEDGYVGLIHISELSEHYVKNVMEYGSIGDIIPCIIVEIDEENKKLKCSIKNTDYGLKKDSLIDHGFAPLKKQLPIWMDEKIKEYNIEKIVETNNFNEYK